MNDFKYADKQHYLDFIEEYSKASNAATGSKVDSNANVEHKTVTTLAGEIYKKEGIGINRLAMQQRLTKLYDRNLADQYINDLELHRIYRHDETIPVGTPYCASVTMYPFLLHGHPQEGACGNDMVLGSVLTEILQCIKGILAFLYLIKDNERFSGDERNFRI